MMNPTLQCIGSEKNAPGWDGGVLGLRKNNNAAAYPALQFNRRGRGEAQRKPTPGTSLRFSAPSAVKIARLVYPANHLSRKNKNLSASLENPANSGQMRPRLGDVCLEFPPARTIPARCGHRPFGSAKFSRRRQTPTNAATLTGARPRFFPARTFPDNSRQRQRDKGGCRTDWGVRLSFEMAADIASQGAGAGSG
jgi:hypothetical protein